MAKLQGRTEEMQAALSKHRQLLTGIGLASQGVATASGLMDQVPSDAAAAICGRQGGSFVCGRGGDEASGGSVVRLMAHGSVSLAKERIVPSSSLATLRFRLHDHA